MIAFVVELENRPGSAAEVTEAIAERGINVTGAAGVACGSTGQVALTTNDEAGTRRALLGQGFKFHEVEVVFEKSANTYSDVMLKYHLMPQDTWMIGNSPRSDINPAKVAGLHTVFIPYHTTWQHEIEEISPNGETLVLESFAQLAEHFA